MIGGAVKGREMTTVAITYSDVRAELEASLLYAEAPEALQYVVEAGKLVKIYWQALGKRTKPDGLISFVKKHYLRN